MNAVKTILLVEDRPADVQLTLRALRRIKVANEVVIARDGVETLEALLPSTGRPPAALPAVVLLDLQAPADRRSRGAAADTGR